MKRKEIVIIGAGKFGSAIIDNLSQNKNFKIILIDSEEEKLKDFKDSVDKIYLGDSTNEKFLKELGIDEANIFVIGIGENIQSSVLTASIIKENFKGRIICKAVTKQHEDILRKIGINEIVSPERAAAKRAFFRIISPLHNLNSNFEKDDSNEEEFATEFDGNISVLKIPAKIEWIGKEIKILKNLNNISLILIYRENGEIELAKGNTKIKNNDKILILGKNQDLVNFLS